MADAAALLSGVSGPARLQRGCPKDRFLTTPDGESGLNYLCAGYRRFFMHIGSCIDAMADLTNQGAPAAAIMDLAQRARL